MDDRTESRDNVDNEEIKKETRNSSRSDEENGTSPSGDKEERRSSRHRDRRKSRVIKSNNTRISKGSKRGSSSKKRRDDKRRRSKQQLLGLSDISNSIGRRASKRPTRASIHLPKNYRTGNDAPAVPRKVFKALQLLRHVKFLRVCSKYLKPKFHSQ